MRQSVSAVCLTATGLWVLVGCMSTKETAEPARKLPLAHLDDAKGATVLGQVRFRGLAPVMPEIDFSSNPQCEREHMKSGNADRERAEAVVVNANRTLRNTLVWIRAGLPAVRWTPPSDTATLDQNGCMYRPHVLALMVNQDLEILNSDSVNHNVHAEAAVNPAFNEAEHPRAETLHKRFDKQEVWFPMTCSVHPWMHSYVAVIGHPYFAVTGIDGSFTLRNVPPGTYTIEAVHEKYGRHEQKIALGPRESKTLDFEYEQ